MELSVTLTIILLLSDGLLPKILFLSGASSPEEIDESVIERYEALAKHPLEINSASLERLSRSGLFSRYQAASILDYRARSGDILSLSELSLVDGFSEEYANALYPFISLCSRSAPGSLEDSLRWKGSFETKTSLRNGDEYSTGAKLHLSRGESFESGIAARRSYEGKWKGTGNLTLIGKRWLGKAILGDFNARFGQGALQWSGFYLTSVSGLSSLVRRPTGITPVTSYSGDGTHRGAAAVINSGRFSFSAFASAEGLKERMEGANKDITTLFGADITYYGRKGEYGITGISKGCFSASGRWSAGGMGYYSELAYSIKKSSLAGIAGLSAPIGKHFKGGMRCRAFPSCYTGKKNGEYSSSLCLEFSDGKYIPLKGKTGFGSSEIRNQASLSVEMSLLPIPSKEPERRMIKTVVIWKTRLSPSFALALRGVDSRRTYDPGRRTDIRSDILYSNGLFNGNLRFNAVYTGVFSILSYIEGGYVKDGFRIYARAAVFKADTWDGRLYCYERDAPGNFSVPAYYGTGYAVSLFAGGKVGKGRLYIRLYGTDTKEKPGKAELKIQYVRDFR